MKFGQTLAARSQPGWRYICYGRLKRMLKNLVEDVLFLETLLQEITEVDTFFRDLQERLETVAADPSQKGFAGAEDLPNLTRNIRSFAVLNYLAVLKILKKHAKMAKSGMLGANTGLASSVHERLYGAEFCACLRGSALFVRMAELVRSTMASEPADSSDTNCPVCLEATPDPAVLPCKHSFCFRCLADCAAHGISTCPLCRQEQSLEPVNLEIETVLGCLAQRYYPEKLQVAKPSSTQNGAGVDLKVMTWNVCALAFPFHIHPAKFAAGLVLGCLWHDQDCDVALQLRHKHASMRVVQQADYIRASGADLVLLQEVLSSLVVKSLQHQLSEEYDFAYMKCRPEPSALAWWAFLLLLVAAVQFVLLQVALATVLGFAGASLLGYHPLQHWLSLTAILAIRWRGSVLTHFLLGDVAGQLLVLRRKGCQSLAGPDFRAEGFDVYDQEYRRMGATIKANGKVQLPKSAVETPSWLSAFFSVRPRGVLRAQVPFMLPGSSEVRHLSVINVHMPHESDNDDLLWQLGQCSAELAKKGPVLLAGDFNPLPGASMLEQFAPLHHFGNAATNRLEDEICTWDLQQSLTRKSEGTPRCMQLDVIFVQQQRQQLEAASSASTGQTEQLKVPLLAAADSAKPPLQLEVCRTGAVHTQQFFATGAPLSDHYGLVSAINLRPQEKFTS